MPVLRTVLILALAIGLRPPAASAQGGGDDADLLNELQVSAFNNTFVEPPLDADGIVVDLTFSFADDAFEEVFEDQTHYVIEYGYYNSTAECGFDFEFMRPPGVSSTCADRSHTQLFPTVLRGATLPVAAILPDTVPEWPNESFVVWLRVAGRPTSEKQIQVFIRSTPLPVHLMGLVQLEVLYPGAGGSVFEGESVWFRVRLSNQQNGEICVNARTIGGSAAPGRDFVPFDRQVCLSPYQVHSATLQVRTLPDDVPRPDRAFSIVLEARYPGNPRVYEITGAAVGIQDGSADLGNLNPGQIWLGPAETIDQACADGVPIPIVLIEPPPGAPPAEYVVTLVFRQKPVAAVECIPIDETLSVTLRPDGSFFSGPSAHPGVDFEIAPRAGRIPHQPFSLTIVQDGVAEPQEQAALRVNAGKYGAFDIPVLLVDWSEAEAFVRSGEADYSRLARMAGGVLASAVADRFSCASSGRCGDAASTLSGFTSAVGRRLGGVLTSLAHRPGAGLGSRGSFGQPFHGPGGVSGAPAPGVSGVQSAAVHLGAGALGPGAGMGGPVFDDSLGSLGRSAGQAFTGGVSFQSSAAPVLNAGGPPVWSAWIRAVNHRSSAFAGAGVSATSRLVGLLFGLDRQGRSLTVGTAYGFLRGGVESRESAASIGHLEVAGSWHMVAPYIGYRLSEDLRLWGTSGFSIAASSEPVSFQTSPTDVRASLLAFQAAPGGEVSGSPGFRVHAFGLSATMLDGGWGVLDLEADQVMSSATGVSGAVHDPRVSLPDALHHVPTDIRHLPGWSGDAAVRRRAGLRVGIPLGSASRVTGHTAARWDSGPDVAQMLSERPDARVRAVDAGVEFRAAPSRARLSLLIRYQMELYSSLSQSPHARSSRRAFDVGVRFGAAESLDGWRIEVRPSYGYPVASSLLLGGAGPESVFGRASLGDPSPLLNVDAGYGFGDGSRVFVVANGPLPGAPASSVPGPGAPGRVLSQPSALRVGYSRLW